ncbi:M20 family metallo-hydrolase [Luteolibacter sp. AS25]|uniref:M20 family metallo-hydrolase n=1 Tax=Luteolibacter sp. AS25 TaxID=3135776 RepID=UPI00398BB1DC
MPTPLQNALDRIDILGGISDHPKHLVRTFLSPANLLAAHRMIDWMESIGMETSHAADGTVLGVLAGSDPTAKPLLIGSHIDTVIDAGKYDGALGLISALAAIETLRDRSIVLPFPVHVLAFSDEEGTRFQTTYLGSRSIVEDLDPTTLAQKDSAGISIFESLEADGWHEGAEKIFYEKGSTHGYVELHIEQGRVLEEAGESLCSVTGINGQSRFSILITGRADHAGTTPMELRSDALTAAAECVLEVEKIAREHTELVATVGKLEVQPGASNSIPQSALFTIDLRHPADSQRALHQKTLENTCREICRKRQLKIDWHLVQENDAVPCDPELTSLLRASSLKIAGTDRLLSSGAGHDGVAISQAMPIGMIFVRCREGLSHHPAEFASEEDIACGIEVLADFLTNFRK